MTALTRYPAWVKGKLGRWVRFRPHRPRLVWPLDRFDSLVVVGTITGAAGFAMIWLPLSLLFIMVVAFSLAAVVDRRSVVAESEMERGEGPMT